MTTSVEVWKPVVGYEGLYEVSNQGRVRSLDRQQISQNGRLQQFAGRILKPSAVGGYPQVGLCVNGKMRLRKVHQLVLEAFVGPRPSPAFDACHCDGTRDNNSLSNLRWDTKKANQADRVIHGTHSRGSQCVTAKLNEVQVKAILSDDRPQRKIAREYGLGETTISRIKRRESWAHVQ